MNKFNRWHSANAYVRVDYAALFEILEMKPKADWQSNLAFACPWATSDSPPRIGAASADSHLGPQAEWQSAHGHWVAWDHATARSKNLTVLL